MSTAATYASYYITDMVTHATLYERIFYKRLIIIKEKLVALQLIYLLKQVYIFTYTNDILGK